MNTKRQTIWLVSMLSIMVVLSAYYLFTDDVNEMDVASDQISTEEIVLDYTNASGQVEDQIWLEDNSNTEQTMDAEVLDQIKTDDEILQEVQAQNTLSSGFFTSMYLEREETISKKAEDLLAVIANGNTEAQTEAWNEYNEMEEQETKLTYLEDMLRQDYENAIITEVDSKWKVVVQTEAMEKSEAVSIMEMVMDEMNAGIGEVSVQIRP